MVTQEIIEECTTLLFLAWLGEKIAGAKLFKKYAEKSPFLHEKLHNYFLGMYLDKTGIFGMYKVKKFIFKFKFISFDIIFTIHLIHVNK